MDKFKSGDKVSWTFKNVEGKDETVTVTYKFAAKFDGLAVVQIAKVGNMDMFMVPFAELSQL